MKGSALAMLRKHYEIRSGLLGRITATEHHISLQPGAHPFNQSPYRKGPGMREETSRHVREQLEAGVIERVNSEWSSPVVYLPMKDGKLRFFVDYRRLNLATLANTYPLPRLDDCIDILEDASVFITLDANFGYWQIPISARDRDKTCFTTHRGTYRYN